MSKNLFSILFSVLISLFLLETTFSADLPKFFGIYVLQNKDYVEVPRIEQSDHMKFNVQHRQTWGGENYNTFNIRNSLKRNLFISTDLTVFNRKGFLVIQDESWSDFQLFRVPHRGKFENNEKGTDIVISIDYGGKVKGMLVSISAPEDIRGLEDKVNPKEIRLKKAKIGENAFIYVPVMPLEKGFYLIDYKKSDKGFVGWNPIQLY